MRAMVWFFAAVALSSVSAAWAQSQPTIRKVEHAIHGGHLTSGSGMALYLFEEDRREGERGRAAESDCVGDCLGRWPPFIVTDGKPEAGEGVDASLIGVFVRDDGRRQATYNGWPLYFFAEDFVAGDTNGHNLDDSGGEWYLLTVSGWGAGVPADKEEGGRQQNGHGGGHGDDQ